MSVPERWSKPPVMALAVLVSATSVAAEQQRAHNPGRREDFQVWSALNLQAPVAGRWRATGDFIAFLTDNSTRLGQLLTRGILDYGLNEQLSVGGGYTYFRVNDGIGADFKEHRALQEFGYKTSEGLYKTRFSLRTRLEERLHEGEAGVAYRLRLLTRLDVPATSRGDGCIAWNETFYAINEVPWQGRPGFAFMMNFVGYSLPVSKRLTLEPGYLNLTYFDAGPNRVRHILAVFATVHL